jgi:serine phosphatase RsbU (regulator of sigma subunit)
VAGAGEGSAEELLDRIVAAVDAWADGAEQSDDITLLAVRRD